MVVGLAGCGGSLAPNGATEGCEAVRVFCWGSCAQKTEPTSCQNGVWQCPPGLTLDPPANCPSSSHLCDGLLLPLACNCDPTSGALSCDGGTDGSACPAMPEIRWATGTIFTCVAESCASDAAVRPICMNGGLGCPSGSVALSPSNVCPAPAADAGAADAGAAAHARGPSPVRSR
jgi:hypothetical protein